MSRNTNASGILSALNLFVAASNGMEIDPLKGPFSYDITDIHRQVLINLFSDANQLLGASVVRANGTQALPGIIALITFCEGLLIRLDGMYLRMYL